MKKTILLLCSLPLLQVAKAQTNTFPASGNVGIGVADPSYKLSIANGSASVEFLYEEDSIGVGDRLFRIANAQGRVLSVNSYQTLDEKLITDLGVNYSINGSSGIHQYSLIGAKHAPFIRLNAENGSIGLFVENGTGSDYRIISPLIGVFIKSDGNVGIGTDNPRERLSVNGHIRAQEIKVENNNWPDYVFSKEYPLLKLDDLERYIVENGHLPEIPTKDEVANQGVNLGEMDAKLLKKIEEMTLYILEQDQQLFEQKQQLEQMKKSIDEANGRYSDLQMRLLKLENDSAN